jgi:hypothetical protein
MSASVARSEKILDRLSRENHLSEAAKQWLIVTLDPFHDNPTNCTGIPDSTSGSSVVQCVKSSTTISCPSGITTGTWDAHIVMVPFMANSATPLRFQSGFSALNTNALYYDETAVGREVTPISIASYPTGYTGSWTNPLAAGDAGSTSKTQTNLALNGNFSVGDYRVVSQGFEVVNTTSPLNVQGLCTAYRTPVPPFVTSTVHETVRQGGDGTTAQPKAYGAVQYLPIQNTPFTPSHALLLPGTKQWHAKEGCYSVAHLNDCDLDVSNNLWIQPLIDRGQVDSTALNNYYFPQLQSSDFGTTPVVSIIGQRPVQWANMDISGAIFSGLSLSTTLTINWNIYIERFPSFTETDLVVLAKPSPEFCPMAFEVYKAIAQNLPVAVMQKENGLGDWFRDAVATATEFITPIASMIPHPAAQAISQVSKIAGNLARRENESPIIMNQQQEKAYLKPVGHSNSKEKKQEKKLVKKEIKREVKAVMPQRKKANRK